MRLLLGDKSYSPNPITVETGNTVTWTNIDNIVHTITSGEPYKFFFFFFIMPSKSFSHKFSHPGEFSYFCRVHPTLVGEVLVEK